MTGAILYLQLAHDGDPTVIPQALLFLFLVLLGVSLVVRALVWKLYYRWKHARLLREIDYFKDLIEQRSGIRRQSDHG